MVRLRKDKGSKPRPSTGYASKERKTGTGMIVQGPDTNLKPVDNDLKSDVSKMLRSLELGVEQTSKQKPKGESKTKGTRLHTPKAKATRTKTILQEPRPPQNPPSSKPLLPPSSKWYTLVPTLTPLTSKPLPPLTPPLLSDLQKRASALLTSAQSSPSATSSKSETSFFQNIIASGTLSDRLSALTLLVQGSPLHNLRALETLKGMAEKGGVGGGSSSGGGGGREVGLKALRCITDWWVGGGAPERKLKYFRDQPLTYPAVTDEHLLVWFFEDWLKKWFFSVLQILEKLTGDPLPYVRTQAVNFIHTLLKDRPEQEQNLLRLLVWKLGDPQKPICARSSHLLLILLQTHPAMKGVVVHEISGFVLRGGAPTSLTSTHPPNPKHIRFTDNKKKTAPPTGKPAAPGSANAHLTYYALITLNQIVLSAAPADAVVARELATVYFEVFRVVLGIGAADGGSAQDEEAQGEEGGEEGGGERGSEGEADKSGGRGRNKKAKGKDRVKGKKAAAGDIPFAELEDSNSKIISAVLTGLHRALPFVGLENDDRLMKHIDTLFLITHKSTFNISLQALVLIQHICASLSPSPPSRGKGKGKGTNTAAAHPLQDRYLLTLYASLHDPRLATTSKQAMYLNLLFKSIKADSVLERQMAFVRRFVQVLVSGGAGIGCAAVEWVVGGLFLLGELFSGVPGLRSLLSSPSPSPSDREDDHSSISAEGYDPLKRSPTYAKASSSPIYELYPLLTHYHPTVSLYTRHLLAEGALPPNATPDLGQNTLASFLDRFVYRNPKKRAGAAGEEDMAADAAGSRGKGGSLMQPAASAVEGVKLMKGEQLERRVNDETWWKRRVEDIGVDQVFFHKYFTMKHAREKAKASKVERRKGDVDGLESGSDADDGDGETAGEKVGAECSQNEQDSDLDEGEIWKAMQRSMPKTLGSEGDLTDSDAVPSGLEDGASDLEDSGDEDDNGDIDNNHEDRDDEGLGSDDALSLMEGSDNEDLLPFEGLIEYDGSDAETSDGAGEDWTGIGAVDGRKRKREEDTAVSKGRNGKKKKALPTFASYEEYAKIIEDGPEDNL